MANNRMYLKNTRTGEAVYIAKYYPSTGWYTEDDITEKLNAAFHKADFGHLTESQKLINQKHVGFGVPYPSAAGLWGAEWVLQLETQGDNNEKIEELEKLVDEGYHLAIGSFVVKNIDWILEQLRKAYAKNHLP